MSNMTRPLESAISLYREGRYDEANELVSISLQANSDDGRLLELHGIIRNAQGNLTGAIASLEHAAAIIPLSLAGQCVLAQCYVAVGHRQLAGEMFRFLLSRPKVAPSLLPLIAAGFSVLEDHQLALEACRRAAECEIDNGEPFFGMAHHMECLDYPLEMIATVLKKAIELEPDRVRYRLALIRTQQRMGQDLEAQAVARQIDLEQLRSLPCANSLKQLIKIYAEAGDYRRGELCRLRIREVDSTGDDES
ncbi:MAG: hypothetical protein GY768_24320 [Planctomycetaceae bacterium]|nr:hypothetical protein [Planctomycetaceae bacterium]